MAETRLRVLKSERVPPTKGPYVQGLAVPAGSLMVLTSGLTGRDETGRIADRDIRGQTRQTLHNIASVLAEGGAGLSDIVKMTVYLRNNDDYVGMHEVRTELLADVPFVSSTIICDLHAPEALVEIEVMAIVPARG